MKRQAKALLLFSGGLDSMLAAKVLQKQGIKVAGLTFVSYFFNSLQAERSAKQLGIRLIKEDFSEAHLKIVKNPKFGSGKGLNPCVDCHALMLKEAWKIKERLGFDILATGEVLGQRPMSQNRQALDIIEKEAGLAGKILRPLSAKLLEPTAYEKENLVVRGALLRISGKGRGEQMRLAKRLGIKNFPSPAGGCRLTEKGFSEKLAKLLKFTSAQKPSDFELIRFGRHFYFKIKNQESNFKITKKRSKLFYHLILGRNEDENNKLEALAERGDVIVKREDALGPTALVRICGAEAGRSMEEAIEEAKKAILKYSKKPFDGHGWSVLSF